MVPRHPLTLWLFGYMAWNLVVTVMSASHIVTNGLLQDTGPWDYEIVCGVGIRGVVKPILQCPVNAESIEVAPIKSVC